MLDNDQSSTRCLSTLQALKYAKQQGALCVGVTNTVGSAIATTTDCGIHVNAGCEIGVASTKAYTSQIVAITLLALVMAEDSVSRKRKYDAVVSALRHLPDSVRRVRSCDICHWLFSCTDQRCPCSGVADVLLAVLSTPRKERSSLLAVLSTLRKEWSSNC